MIFFITKLWEYFGPVGILSIVVWLTSLYVLAKSARYTRKTRYCWRALGIAIVGLVLARINSHHINQIRYDQRDEIQAGRELGRILAAEESGTNVISDLAEPETVLTNAAMGAAEIEARKYTYRAQGRVEREAGKAISNEVAGIEVQTEEEEEEPQYRMMKAEDLHRANRYDKMNLFCARGVVWLALILVVLDYLRRLNTTFDAYFPLPLASPWLEAAFPKPHSVCLDAGNRGRIRECLQQAVRRGETFVYFAGDDPWSRDILPRLVLCGCRLRRLKKIRCSTDGEPFTSTWVFESAWFGRYCFVVAGVELSRRWLVDLERFLIRRQAVRASTRRTVNIVWDFDEPVPTERLEELLFLCRETNYKLIMVSNRDSLATLASKFEEVAAVCGR